MFKGFHLGGWNLGDDGRRKEILFGGVLAVLVVASLTFALIYLFRPKMPPRQTHRFQCRSCQYVFELTSDKIHLTRINPEGLHVDCPKCGAKESAAEMTQCPACKEWFVPAPKALEIICPKCGANTVKVATEQAHKKLNR